MCLMFTLWGASPLGVISNVSPLGVPADLQSADKKGSTYFMRICNPPQARMQHHKFGDMKSLRLRIANPL